MPSLRLHTLARVWATHRFWSVMATKSNGGCWFLCVRKILHIFSFQIVQRCDVILTHLHNFEIDWKAFQNGQPLSASFVFPVIPDSSGQEFHDLGCSPALFDAGE